MKKRSAAPWPIAAAAPLLLLLALVPGDAAAQTAIYHSKPENTYGWCADHGSYEKTRECARGYCAEQGSDCQLVLECEDGWAAIASSAHGFGAACKRSETFYARQWALVYCIVNSGELCATDYTFNGGKRESDADNKAFDDAWYAQLLLMRLGYKLGTVDGVVGAKTRQALKEYQQSRGLAATGKITPELLDMLFAEKGGVAEAIAIIKRDLYDVETNPSPAITYGYGAQPAAPATDPTLADALAAYEAGDYEKARSLWAPLADGGNAIAQYNLGLLYENGKGVAQDNAKAAELYRKAAEQGHASAQLNLGYLYDHGLGVTEDHALAAQWYLTAAEQGDVIAQRNIAFMYEDGDGIPQDYALAAAWYRKAANQGDAIAQNNLGYLYEMGRGVTKDFDEAAAWYRKAADQGLAQAQADLGYLYEEGLGVPQDIEVALEW